MSRATSQLVWHASPCEPMEDMTALHVWQCDLDRDTINIDPKLVLSANEIARAQRLVDTQKRARCLASRVLLRQIFGKVLKLNPRAVEFAFNEHGKPRLAQGDAVGSLQFNLSHSENLWLLGVSFGREIGVDVEVVRADVNIAALTENYFSLAEQAWLMTQSATDMNANFFRLWTRKEAFVKALGSGISAPLNQLDTHALPSHWTIIQRDFTVDSRNAIAAFVVKSKA